MHMVTTSHFGSPKYRPVSRIVNYLCQVLTPAPVLMQRLRNLVFHLLAVWLTFALAIELGAAAEVAGSAAALFGVHPLTHQTISAAIFTVDFGYALMLLALWMFIRAYRSQHKGGIILVGSGVVMFFSLFTYEPTIICYGCYAVYMGIKWLRQQAPAMGWRRWLSISFPVCAIPIVMFFIARRIFAVGSMPITPPGKILFNLGLFAGSLGLPVDLLLLNSWFDTPMPNELVNSKKLLLGIGIGLLVLVGAAVANAWRLPAFRERWRAIPWLEILFLITGILFSWLPFLVYTDHPSETYQYLPAAFYSIAASMFIAGLLGTGWRFRAIFGVLVLLAAMASWVRTDLVKTCAVTAERIIRELPIAQWRQGTPWVRMAHAVEIPPASRYGLYAYYGLSTISPSSGENSPLQDALRLETGNEKLRAGIFSAWELARTCQPGDPCFLVEMDGHVIPFRR